MNLETLKKLVIQGESERLEFKKSTGQRSDAAKAVCAMLNGRGGHVLFGVTDKGEMRGQSVSSRTLEDIARELGKIEPSAFPDIQSVPINGMRVIVLTVEGGSGLYTYDGRPYLRHGATTQVMPRLPPTRVSHNLSPLQRKLLQVLARTGPIASKQIRVELSSDVPKSTILDNLRTLRDLGLVTLEGKGRAAKWQLSRRE